MAIPKGALCPTVCVSPDARDFTGASVELAGASVELVDVRLPLEEDRHTQRREAQESQLERYQRVDCVRRRGWAPQGPQPPDAAARAREWLHSRRGDVWTWVMREPLHSDGRARGTSAHSAGAFSTGGIEPASTHACCKRPTPTRAVHPFPVPTGAEARLGTAGGEGQGLGRSVQPFDESDPRGSQ